MPGMLFRHSSPLYFLRLGPYLISMSNVTYHLGTIINGQTYVYTGLGEFRTVEAALARTTEPRAIVFRQEQLTKHGINYGCTGYVPVAQKR